MVLERVDLVQDDLAEGEDLGIMLVDAELALAGAWVIHLDDVIRSFTCSKKGG